jgi:hypothetical protein
VPEQSAKAPTGGTSATPRVSQFVTFARIFRAANALIRLGNPAKTAISAKSDFCGTILYKGITHR